MTQPLPKPPAPPRDIPEEMRQYVEDTFRFQRDLIRVVQDALVNIERNYQKRGEPVLIPPATVGDLVNSPQRVRSGLTPDGLYKLVYVTDETGGSQPAVTDGTDFRRLTDRAVVS